MFLYGASGHAKVVIDILQSQNINIEGLVDDNMSLSELCGFPVSHTPNRSSSYIVSIGDNSTRKKIVERLALLPISFCSAIHPSAVVSSSAVIKEGTVVLQGSIIQASAKIGRHNIINTGSSIDHDCLLGDFVHISPHATLCGHVSVGEGTWIGAGSTIIQGVSIGKWCVIGAGSVVTKDIPDGVLAVGNRCEIIKQLNFND